MHKILLFMLLISSLYSAQTSSVASPLEEQNMWFALFGLGAIGLLSLLVSSYRLKRIVLKHQELLQLKEDTNIKHQVILETMGQNIEVSAKGIRRYKEVLKKNDFKTISEDFFQEEMNRFEKSETLLLDATHELIDFLQIKSSKLEIVDESYKLNNVLNETYGFISDHIVKYKTELLYDIDPDMSTELQGDSKRISQVLRTFLIDILSSEDSGRVTLHVSSDSEDSNHIIFKLHNKTKKMLNEEINALFSNYTIDESYKSKDKLDLYVAYELVKQMDGSLDVQSNEANGTTYTIVLPYKPIKTSPLKSQKSVNKRLLILEDDEQGSQNLFKIFQQHDLNIDCADSQSLVSHMPDFHDYDIVIVNTKLLFLTIVEKLEKVKKEKSLIVVETYNSYETRYTGKSYQLVDESIQKPFQNEQVYELLEKVFEKKSDEKTIKTQSKSYAALPKVEGITIESFAKFSNTHVLIVEDNIMNQKLLKGVLRNSGMKVIIVNNGQEALDEIEKNGDFNLVLMDTNMPVMDGYEATEKIRKKYDREQLPIVAISAVGFKNDISKMESAGANTFLHKPFQLGELYSAFSKYATQSKSKVNKIDLKDPKYKGNVDILNIEKGIKYSSSAVFYKELLQEVLTNLNEIDDQFIKWIHKRKDKKSKEFISHALKLAETIGASSFEKILKEMYQLFVYKEENRLSEYLPIYTKEWHKLSKEIEGYLKS